MSYPVHLVVEAGFETQVSRVQAEIRALDEKVLVDLDAGDGSFASTADLPGLPRYFGLRLFCGDEAQVLVCYDAVVFTESPQGQELLFLLEPTPGSVAARRIGADGHMGTEIQLLGGLAVLGIIGAWAVRRSKARG